jgi:glycosyltransferase involved in cell wall biosynthesis
VVATNWGGAKEMIVEGETGFVVPVDDAAVLADRLKTLASSEELRRSFGAAGQARARELFTRQRMCSEFWAIMDEVAASRGAVRLRAAPR